MQWRPVMLMLGLLITSCALAAGAGAASAQAVHPWTSDLQSARNQWVSDETVTGGADEAVPLVLVVADLRQAITAGADRDAYTRLIGTIIAFGELPDAMQTPAQSRESKTDFAAINHFFGFSANLWNRGCISHGSGVRAAATAWAGEPQGTTRGVSETGLQDAVADLERGQRSDVGDRSCYPAAIDDLEGIQRASAAQLRATATLKPTQFWQAGAVQVLESEIIWLNNWLSFEASSSKGIAVLTG